MSNIGNDKIRSQGYRIRLVLHDLDDFRKKSYLFVRFKHDRVVKNIIYKIWCFFYKDLCSSPNQVILSSGGFYVPPHEPSFILQPNELIDVHVDRGEASRAAASAPGDILENSEVAEVTDLPETMIESVGVALKRMRQDAPTAEKLARSKQVAAIVDGKSASSDASTSNDSEHDAAMADYDAVARTASKCAGASCAQDVAAPPTQRFSSSIKDKTAALNSGYCRQRMELKDGVVSPSAAKSAPGEPAAAVKRTRTSSSSTEDSGSSSSDSDLSEADVREGDAKADKIVASTPVVSSSKANIQEQVQVESSCESSDGVDEKSGLKNGLVVNNLDTAVEGSEVLPSAPDLPESVQKKNPRKRRRRRRGAKQVRSDSAETEAPRAPEPRPQWDRPWRPNTLSHAQIDKMKRSASVAINWNTRPANRRFVFDEDGVLRAKDEDGLGTVVPNPGVSNSLQQSSAENESVAPTSAVNTTLMQDATDRVSLLRPEYLQRKDHENNSYSSLTMIPRGLRMQPRTRISAPRRHEADKNTEKEDSGSSPAPRLKHAVKTEIARTTEKRSDSYSSSVQQEATASLATCVLTANGTSQPLDRLSTCSIDQLCQKVLAGQQEPFVVVRSHLHTPPGGQTRHLAPAVSLHTRSVLANGQSLSREESDSDSAEGVAHWDQGVSADSIDNCNVVNQVGQNRRLQKERLRAGSSPVHMEEDDEGLEAGHPPATKRSLPVKNDQFYHQFPLMSKPPRFNDIIAFKRLELAADYSPHVSAYREARVLEPSGPSGTIVRLQLLDAPVAVPRRGRFELHRPEGDEVVDLCEESGLDEVEWKLLIEPRLMFP